MIKNKVNTSRIYTIILFIIFGIGVGCMGDYFSHPIAKPSQANVETFNKEYAESNYIPVASTLVADDVQEVSESLEIIGKPVESCEMDAIMQRWLIDYCNAQGVDPYLIMAMCHHESTCRPDAISSCGCVGMMQLSPWYYEDILYSFGFENPDWYNPYHNIQVGIVVISNMINTGNGIEWALACYNGGGAWADAGNGRDYAAVILETAEYYRSQSQ